MSPESATRKPATTRRPAGPEPLRRRRAAATPRPSPRRRGLNVLLAFVMVVLAVDALVGEKGLTENLRARQESRHLAADVDRLRGENAALRERVRRLKEDAVTIESVARQELGLVRPGELLVILKNVKPAR